MEQDAGGSAALPTPACWLCCLLSGVPPCAHPGGVCFIMLELRPAQDSRGLSWSSWYPGRSRIHTDSLSASFLWCHSCDVHFVCHSTGLFTTPYLPVVNGKTEFIYLT